MEPAPVTDLFHLITAVVSLWGLIFAGGNGAVMGLHGVPVCEFLKPISISMECRDDSFSDHIILRLSCLQQRPPA